MEDKIVKLIDLQVEKLHNPEFDLEAWKSGTTALISRFLGESDPRIKQLENLKIDYSSWALRDSNSKYNPIETCKKKGKAILQTIVDEVQLMGLPTEQTEPSVADKLRNHLSNEEVDAFVKDPGKSKLLSSLKKEKLVAIIQDLVS